MRRCGEKKGKMEGAYYEREGEVGRSMDVNEEAELTLENKEQVRKCWERENGR